MKLITLAGLTALLSFSTSSSASPWIESGDPLLRASIEALFNQGVIKQPVNSYPLMWQGIAKDLHQLDISTLPTQSLFAYQHVKQALANAQQQSSSGIRVNYNNAPLLQQSFGSRDQQKSGVNSYGSITGNRVSAKVSVNYADEALDDKYTNNQGSYLAVLVADWSISAEQISHWWGPSNDNALLLSNNAAPMKGIRVNRANTHYDGPSFFSFIGNWQLTGILAKQKPTLSNNDEGDFWAIRFASTPLPGLEIAFSTSGSEFLTSTYTTPNTLEPETKKQQLTSLDAKYSTHFSGLPIGFYVEVMGKNDSGFAPSNPFYTLGVESFFGNNKQLIKTYVEYTNTQKECLLATDCHYGNDTLVNASAGYAHSDRLIGSSTPLNSQSAVLGAYYHTMNGYAGFTKLSWFESDKISQTPDADKVKRIQLELGYQQALFEGLFKVSGAVYQDTFNNDSNTDTALKTSWEYRF